MVQCFLGNSDVTRLCKNLDVPAYLNTMGCTLEDHDIPATNAMKDVCGWTNLHQPKTRGGYCTLPLDLVINVQAGAIKVTVLIPLNDTWSRS